MYIRENYVNQLIAWKDSDFIKVITGVRRSGKSVILQQYMDYLLKEGVPKDHIIYLNLEAFEYQSITTRETFSELIMKKMPHDRERFYLLVDEIQFVEGWQKVINGLRVSYDCDIIITGSNANLLSGELATLLSGRYVEIKVFPFSFNEFLGAKGIERSSRHIDAAYKEYETFGGFPGVVLSPESLKQSILSGIYDSIILSDIGYRGNVKDVLTLKRFVSFLADNVGQLVNPTNISKLMKHEKIDISNHTINKYLSLLEEAYLFFEARPYDLRGKSYLKTNSKYFMIDNGLRNQAVSYKSGNLGNRLENMVYLELIRRGFSVDVVRLGTKEVDFMARKNNTVAYYQVCYQLPENTHESDNLLLIQDNFKKYIITGRYAEVDEIDGIEVKYIADWLLEE